MTSPDRSEPAPGSLKSWHQISCALTMAGSHRRHWSGVPCARSVGPARLIPTRLTSCGAPLRAYSALKMRHLDGRRPPTPVLDGPIDPDPTGLGQLRLPGPAAPDRLGEVVVVVRDAVRVCVGVGGDDVGFQPRPHLVRETLLGLGQRQVHLVLQIFLQVPGLSPTALAERARNADSSSAPKGR